MFLEVKQAMLRVIQHIPSSSVQDTPPSVQGWDVDYRWAEHPDEIGTVLCACYRWDRLPMPKKDHLKTPAILPKWFAKILRKRHGIKGSSFLYSDSMIEFKIQQSPISLSPFAHDCYIYPLFQNSLSDYTDISASDRIPEFLKLEIRSVMEEHYTDPFKV